MRLVPIVYVSDMHRSVTFFTGLGATVGGDGINPYWTEMRLSGTAFALHIHEPFEETTTRRLGLSVAVDQPLEAVAARLAGEGIDLDRGIADEAFGRSMVVRDPDGLAIQINEHDPAPR